MRALVRFAVLLALGGSLAAQTTWLVPDDSATIQGAVDLAASGDTIRVRPGVYAESVAWSGKMLTLESTRGAGVTTRSSIAASSSASVSAANGRAP